MTRVSVAVINKDGRILIAKREKAGPLQNLWEFPGGKIEPGETPEECVRREVFEELGLTIERVDFLCASRYRYDHGSVELFAFMVRRVQGNPERTVYGTIKWVNPGELLQYEFPEANHPIIEKIVHG
jgi:8-oxo-dGTP diphosphatase